MKTLTRLGTMLAIVALLAPAASAQNLLTNPGFEDNGGSYDGWFTFGNGPNISTAGTDNIFLSGTAAAKIFGEFTGCPFPAFDVGGFGQSFTPTAGKVYTFSGFSFVSSADTIPGEIVCERTAPSRRSPSSTPRSAAPSWPATSSSSADRTRRSTSGSPSSCPLRRRPARSAWKH